MQFCVLRACMPGLWWMGQLFCCDRAGSHRFWRIVLFVEGGRMVTREFGWRIVARSAMNIAVHGDFQVECVVVPTVSRGSGRAERSALDGPGACCGGWSACRGTWFDGWVVVLMWLGLFPQLGFCAAVRIWWWGSGSNDILVISESDLVLVRLAGPRFRRRCLAGWAGLWCVWTFWRVAGCGAVSKRREGSSSQEKLSGHFEKGACFSGSAGATALFLLRAYT